jgi:phage major head subunit gpT-like protein
MVAERPKGPAIHSSSQDVSMPAIEAAFCRSCGMSDEAREKQFAPEVLAAGDRYRNIGIQELLLICAAQNGYTGRQRVGSDNLREVIEAAFSVHTITTLLTSTGNKLLLEGFNRLPQSWRQVAEVRSVSDFKAVTLYRMTASLEYEEVGPGGTIEHGTAGQESYSVQAKTYARMLALTRQDIINDDLGAFDDLRNRLGLGAAIKLNKVFWTAWLAAVNGAAFWTAARGNYQTGAATALGETALNTAVKLFRDASGPDGNLLGLEPEILLTPSDLEATNRKLYTSQEVRDTTASTKTLVNNIYFNRFRPVIVPELGNSAYTGYSTTHWFLLCNPAVLASAVMCFLNGQQSPTIESTDADFNTLGIQSRGYHDFGVTMSEYRASVLSAGA